MFSLLKTTYLLVMQMTNTPFVVKYNTADVIKALEKIGENLVKKPYDNQMKLNTDNCLVLLNSQGPNLMEVGKSYIRNSSCEKLTGIHFDNKLKYIES